MQKESILGLPFEKLKQKFIENGLTALDAKRVFPWIHRKLAKSFFEMTDMPKNTRENVLQNLFSLERPQCDVIQKSSDGTEKALLKFVDGEYVETVFIPDEKRNTVCVSSQIGCPVGCKFCYTGTQNFSRNLTSSEIMAQLFFWKDRYPEKITNIVFMGMGEPLLNTPALFDTLELLLSEKSHNFSRNKVTVSTAGVFTTENVVDDLAKFGVKLAISLHAPNDKTRSAIMSINKKYDIATIMDASEKYLALSNTSHVTFEYLLLDGVNDSRDDAKKLAKLLKRFDRLSCRVNLIVFNDWSNANFKKTDHDNAHDFLKMLLGNGIRAIIRKSRGDDISAACGQLKSPEK